jgi:DivIVA domain-containing protein
MPLTPQDIESRIFEVRKRGYDKTQVDRFLGEVAAALRTMQETGTTGPLPAQPPVVGPAGAHQTAGAPLTPTSLGTIHPPGSPSQPPYQQPPYQQAPYPQPPYHQLGSEVAAVLASAQEQADALRHDAEAKVARLKAETEEYARKMQAEAQRYAAGRQQEADHDRNEAARALAHAREQAAAATWAHEEAQRVLETARAEADAELDEATHEADRILEQAERAARARVEGVIADADRRLEEASAALSSASGPVSASPRSERRRPPTSPLRGGRRRTDPPVIDLVRDQDPIIDLVEGGHQPGRVGAEAASMQQAGGTGPAPGPSGDSRSGERPSADPLATLLSDAMGDTDDQDGNRPGPA